MFEIRQYVEHETVMKMAVFFRAEVDIPLIWLYNEYDSNIKEYGAACYHGTFFYWKQEFI